jgi:class 3 adenylate cyclase
LEHALAFLSRSTQRGLATVLFGDIVGSTETATGLGDRRWKDLLEEFLRMVRDTLQDFGGREVDTAGDGFLAVFDGPRQAIACAASVGRAAGRLGLEMRAGIHSGEIERAGYAVRGIAVQIGARVAAEAAPGEILVTRTVRDLLLGSGIELEDRGGHTLKGVSGEWELFAVTSDSV